MKTKLSCWNWKRPFHSIKNCYWRIKYGYCPDDTYDLGTYWAQLIHDNLMYFAANHHGISPNYCFKFDNVEENDRFYTDKIEDVARKLLIATYWEDNYPNVFSEKYYKALDNHKMVVKEDEEGRKFYTIEFPEDEEYEGLRKHFLTQETKNFNKAKKEVKQALNWIAEEWFDLWD